MSDCKTAENLRGSVLRELENYSVEVLEAALLMQESANADADGSLRSGT
jgi:hypothetical protein